MILTIITLIIGGASVYFFYEYNFVVAIVLLTWFLSRLFGYSLKRIFEGIDNSEVEKHSNIAIELKINIATVLNHQALSLLFEKLKENKKFSSKFSNKSQWVETLIDNYKKKYNNENDFTHEGIRYFWDSVKYNIKNNILWKNTEIDFSDCIVHEIYIPYEYKKEKESYFRDVKSGIMIRVIITNGLIKVQVGNFDKETSPQIYNDSGLATYKTWETITTFPLMYVSQAIPTSYLNLSMYATESYKGMLKREASKDWTKDWKELNAEIKDYNYLKAALMSDTPADKKFQNTYKKFYKKSLEKLALENFTDPYKREDNDWSGPGWLENNNINYINNYLSIFIADYKDAREKNKKYYLTDYYEEQP